MNRQKSFENERPTLYLVATPIGNLDEMTYRSINTLKNVKYIAAEDTRNTVKLLNHFEISTKLISHHEHNIKQSIPKLIQLLEEGNDIALVSDAGYPAISDPGYELVKEAIEHEINVVPISGCNACLDALVVSGIAPQPFMFYGFLDHLDKKKKKELIDLKKYKETIVFYESPHRIKKTLNLMLDILGDRNIALCREITKKHEEIIRGHISEIISIVEELKGEMVIVVEGSQEVEEEITFETTIKEDVDMYIEKGMSTKDAIKEVIAKQDGEVISSVKTRELRTRHGDIVNISNYETDIELKGAKRTEKYHIPAGSTVFFTNGMKVKKGFKLAQFEPAAQGSGSRLTEKATKDITSDLSGEVLYEDFVADEKKDRQGNISRTTNKQGIIWVLGGDVYNLPGG